MNRIASYDFDGAGDPNSVTQASRHTSPSAPSSELITAQAVGEVDPESAISDAGPEDNGKCLAHTCPEPRPTAPAEDHGDPSGPISQPAISAATADDWAEAQARANLCEDFLELTGRGKLSLRSAAVSLGKSPSYFSGDDSILARYQRGGVAALLPERRGPGAGANPGDLTATLEGLGWFIPAARFFWLITNRTCNSGSVPEAVRRAISLPNLPAGWDAKTRTSFLRALKLAEPPTCPPELRERILSRERAGKPFVPTRIHRQILARAATVRQFRNAKEASLDYLSAPGGMRMVNDFTVFVGKRRARALEIVEADDGSINFPVCIPWPYGGDRCSDKFGVLVTRGQWLRSIDVGTSYRPGYVYVARPRGSYRGEDALTLVDAICRQHGLPATFRFERGVWKSTLITTALQMLGIRLDTVYSPHQKPFVEGGFNQDWTKLSAHFPQCDLGRFAGDTHETNLLVQSCRAGATDPRKHFPLLETAMAAFREITDEENQTPVNSDHHGRWIPAQRWQEDLAEFPVRPLDPASAWMLAPMIREWTVNGMLVGGRIPIFEELSVPFDFSAPWLPQYDGARVRVHFDPALPRCIGHLVLAQPWHGQASGTVLGPAEQINDQAGYVRLVMGWAKQPEMAGHKARQQAAAGLRRAVRGIVPTGRGLSTDEERDGMGTVTKVESGKAETGKAESRNADTADTPHSARRTPHSKDRGPGTKDQGPGTTPHSALRNPHSIDPERLARAEQWEAEHALDFA
jgi:hypothetical protein